MFLFESVFFSIKFEFITIKRNYIKKRWIAATVILHAIDPNGNPWIDVGECLANPGRPISVEVLAKWDTYLLDIVLGV